MSDEPPKTIWLQWYGDSDESESGPVAESEVTYCRDKVFDRDIRYVRADLISAKPTAPPLTN